MEKEHIIKKQVEVLGIPSKDMIREEIARRKLKKSYKKLMYKIMICVTIAVAVMIVITNLWIAVLQIDGSSMNPLLHMNEIVLVTRGGTPDRNDIIAFYYKDKLHVKRVIAIAGDMVDINDDGVVTLNKKPLEEPYVAELSYAFCDMTFPLRVPNGTVFVLGDNRAHSMDSRDSAFGFVNREQIVGKVKFSVWPLPRFGSVN